MTPANDNNYDCSACTYRPQDETFCGVCMYRILDEWTAERNKYKENLFNYVVCGKGIYVLDKDQYVDGVPLKIAFINPFRKIFYFIYPIPNDIRNEIEEYARTREFLYKGLPVFRIPPKRAKWEP